MRGGGKERRGGVEILRFGISAKIVRVDSRKWRWSNGDPGKKEAKTG
jgi:hypothetical protein